MSFSKRFCAKNPFKPSPLRTESKKAEPVTKKTSSSDWTKEAEEQAHNRNKYTTDANIRKGAGADLGTIQSTSTEENKGAIGQMHKHPHSQTSYVVSGSFEVTIGNEKKVLNTGDGYYIPTEVMHGAVCLADGVLIDAFSPHREDFLQNPGY